MIRIKKLFPALVGFLIFSSPNIAQAVADDTLVFGMSMRFRYEFQDNFNQKYYGENPKLGSADDGFLLGRLRAGFDYKPSEKIHLALWLQDSECWDMALPDSAFYDRKLEMGNNPNKDHWELWETYLEIMEPADVPLTVKVGRQRIYYGDKRIFGPGEWGNTGRWIWDAAKFSHTFQGGFVDAYYGRTMVHEPTEFSLNHRHYYESFGFYGQYVAAGLSAIGFEPFFMSKQDDHESYTGEDGRTGNLDAYYGGLRIFKNDLQGFDGSLTYVRQFGDYAGDDIRAYGYHALLAYNLKQVSMKPRVSVEYSFASGDSDPGDGRHESFDGAFGARDTMYGRMNLFHWMNLKDAQINLEIRPRDWFYLKAEFHKFRLAEEKDAWYLNASTYRDKAGMSGDEVGREFDLVGKFDLPKGNTVQVGFGHFWPDEFAEKLASSKEANWVFVEWMYKFSTGIF
ncbi:MAG: alginate export family protein [Proteobacteria bacterium]|nr:alginate export family protein [Pseudomonadota bacterium]MBU4295512.1 alginate export family protein [Pseudomonadota bacterium]MCG2749495.1 alginate export family protein [Desulfobulbaceae bacterium]